MIVLTKICLENKIIRYFKNSLIKVVYELSFYFNLMNIEIFIILTICEKIIKFLIKAN